MHEVCDKHVVMWNPCPVHVMSKTWTGQGMECPRHAISKTYRVQDMLCSQKACSWRTLLVCRTPLIADCV